MSDRTREFRVGFYVEMLVEAADEGDAVNVANAAVKWPQLRDDPVNVYTVPPHNRLVRIVKSKGLIVSELTHE